MVICGDFFEFFLRNLRIVGGGSRGWAGDLSSWECDNKKAALVSNFENLLLDQRPTFVDSFLPSNWFPVQDTNIKIFFFLFPSREDLLSLERMIDRNKLDENHVNGSVSVGAVELNRQRRGDWDIISILTGLGHRRSPHKSLRNCFRWVRIFYSFSETLSTVSSPSSFSVRKEKFFCKTSTSCALLHRVTCPESPGQRQINIKNGLQTFCLSRETFLRLFCVDFVSPRCSEKRRWQLLDNKKVQKSAKGSPLMSPFSPFTVDFTHQ